MGTGRHDRLLAAIDTAYDCIGDAYDRARAVQTYSEVAHDSGVIFADVNILLGSTTNLHWHNVEDEAIKSFNRRFQCPARDKLVKTIMSHPPCVPILRQSVLSEDEWLTSEMYKVGSQPWGFHSHGTSYISGKILTKTFCFFLRHPGQDSLDAETLSMLAILNTHLRRALNLQHRIHRLEETVIKSNNILDLIEFGLVLYDVDKTPVFVNAAAQRILNAKDGLRWRANAMEIDDRAAKQQFQSLIDGSYHPATPANQRSGGVMSIPRVSRLRPYSLMVSPMHSHRSTMENVTVAVFIFDPHHPCEKTAINLFVSSYELTSPEAKLAQYLVLGYTLEDIAQLRTVSRNTIKTQLQSIFSKTGTNRQSELVSLLLRSVAGMSLKI